MNFLLNALGVLVWVFIIGIVFFAIMALLVFCVAVYSSTKEELTKKLKEKERRKNVNGDE